MKRMIAVMRKERTDYGKEVRKQYENGAIKLKRREVSQYVPRVDGICNTITGVLKDNYLYETES